MHPLILMEGSGAVMSEAPELFHHIQQGWLRCWNLRQMTESTMTATPCNDPDPQFGGFRVSFPKWYCHLFLRENCCFDIFESIWWNWFKPKIYLYQNMNIIFQVVPLCYPDVFRFILARFHPSNLPMSGSNTFCETQFCTHSSALKASFEPRYWYVPNVWV